jgi:hypothetical protein
MLWPKEKKDTQYYGRKKKDKQYYDRKKQRTDNTMAERNKGQEDNNEAQSTTQNMYSCTIVPRLLV